MELINEGGQLLARKVGQLRSDVWQPLISTLNAIFSVMWYLMPLW